LKRSAGNEKTPDPFSGSHQVIGILWILFGAALATNVAIDVFGAINAGYSIDTGLVLAFAVEGVGSVLAIVSGIALLFSRYRARYVALLTSILFAVYLVLYLIFGGEGSLLVRVIVPFVLIALCVTTIKAVRQKRMPD
jgi:hypothetical protein